ncbi:glycerophosphodiester phosphodiesterase [Candidatus Lokiarchaeum ossiferum]|uniref:glycerophosphodiester phosphodiesterase n=1 Tax=Candidatus Lokiarchaeum ossiferum TaxID=2951803 RepID=UPI00352BFE62
MISISHRGFCQGIPENSLLGIQKSLDLRMNFIEIDVQLTQDQKLVVFHDTSLSRIYGVDSLIGETKYEDLKEYSTKIGLQNISLLSEIIAYMQVHSNSITKLMIELKGMNSARPTCEIIKKYGFQKHCVFSGRYLSELILAHKLLPKIPICLNITKCKEFTLEDLLNSTSAKSFPIPFTMFSLKSDLITNEEFIQKCHSLGVKAFAWNFKDKLEPLQLQKELCAWGLDGILFDNPQNLLQFRDFIKTQKSP